jgi:type II secretory pathway pseudopilin PulG
MIVAIAVVLTVFVLIGRRRKARQRRAVAGLAESINPLMSSYSREIPRGFFKGHGGSM